MLQWLKRILFKDESTRITYLYHLVIALARLQMIHPEVLSAEANKYQQNEEYASKVQVTSGKQNNE